MGLIINSPRLTVATQGDAVAPLPVGTAGGASLVGGVALGAQAAVALASGGQATQLTVLVHRVADPVDAGILQVEEKCVLTRPLVRA